MIRSAKTLGMPPLSGAGAQPENEPFAARFLILLVDAEFSEAMFSPNLIASTCHPPQHGFEFGFKEYVGKHPHQSHWDVELVPFV